MDREEVVGDVVGPRKEFTFQIDQLPEPALHNLFKLLNGKDQKCMRRLCKGMKSFIDHEFGICVILPPKYSYWSTRTISQAFEVLEGKVIRSFAMNQTLRDFHPFPFETLVRYPWKLMSACLTYVDVDLLLMLLNGCRNLKELHYSTGEYKYQLEYKYMSIVPTENGQLIEILTQLPRCTFQVDKLSSLSLRLGKVDPRLHSDWANVVFLLLSLSQRTLYGLKSFIFDFHTSEWLHLKDHLQILGCIGQFLARSPNLKKLKYSKELSVGLPPDPRDTPRRILPQNVLSCLFQKYGSALLNEMQEPEALGLGVEDQMLMPIRQIMKEAGRNLRILQDVRFEWGCRFEPELFQIFLSELPSPSLRKIGILNQTGQSFTGGSYDLILGRRQTIQPFYWNLNLEQLVVSRVRETMDNGIVEEDGNGPFSLPRMLSQMPSLAEIRFEPREPHTDTEELYRLGMHAHYRLNADRNDIEIPDVTFEQVGHVHFQALRVLRLEGVKMSIEATARLIQLRNLEELALHVLPEYRHQLFGIKSEDLLRLMGTLRKLGKLAVTMILFPQDEVLKSVQVEVFQGLGHLTQMQRGVTIFNPHSRHFRCVDTKPMIQYKFEFGH